MTRIIIFFLLLISQSVWANKIDSLKTDAEVERFLKTFSKDSMSVYRLVPKVLTTDSIRKKLACNGIFDKWKIRNWEKADFNNDGKTDIIITAFWSQFQVFVVIDRGNNVFQLIQVSKNIFEDCELAKPIKIGKQTALLFYQKKQEYIKDGKNPFKVREVDQIDTLVYKFDGFVEWNKYPAHYQINSIEFNTSGCFGSCPVYTLKIDLYRNMTYIAEKYNTKEGTYTSILEQSAYDQLLALINYINLKQLNNNYVVEWTDDQTAYLSIKFKDGTVKKIRDYGFIGTFGLSQLYHVMAQIKNNQVWN